MAGAGAVGCHYASLLVQAGLNVVCLMRGQHLQAVVENGLIHISNGQEHNVSLEAGTDPAILENADIVMLTCKMTDLSAMLDAIAGHVRSDALVVTLQNGVQAPAMVADLFPGHGIAAGSAFIGVRIERPGVIVHSAAGGVCFGVFSGGKCVEKQLDAMVQAFIKAGIAAQKTEDVQQMLWRKMLWNCGFNAITALTRCYARGIAGNPAAMKISLAAMRETADVARAEGVEVGESDINAHIQTTLRMGLVKTSVWQDIERGRLTEVDYMNGFVAKRGSELGLEIPVNRMLTAMIHAAQQGFH